MSADPKVLLTDLLKTALKSVAPDHADTAILLERPKQASHGDFATNLALQLAKPLKRNPRDLAALLLAELPATGLVAKAEVAGAGFINFTLASDAKTAVVRDVLARLQERGLIRKNAASHWIAGPLTARTVSEKFELRGIVEPAALRLAAPHIR